MPNCWIIGNLKKPLPSTYIFFVYTIKINWPRFSFIFLFFSDSPSFQSLVENITLIAGMPSKLLCQAQGGPAPVITWYKGAYRLQNSTSVTYWTTSYSPEAYTCDAENSFGLANKTIMVNIQSKWFNGNCVAFTCAIIYVGSPDGAVMRVHASRSRRHAYVGRVPCPCLEGFSLGCPALLPTQTVVPSGEP